MDVEFSETEISRYSRHILLDEVGGVGQARLRAARVLVVGAGGLGSPVLLYLAAAGIGTLGVVDHDVVDLSNLHRQIAHSTARVGQRKVHSAAVAAHALNPGVTVHPHDMRLSPACANDLVAQYDLVCDCSDNFPTRFLVAEACRHVGRTLVSAAAVGFEGRLCTFKCGDDPQAPCFRCLYPDIPPEDPLAGCAGAGVLGPVTGVMGTLQATEVIKEILHIGQGLSGRLLVWNALTARFRTATLLRDPGCPGCGSPGSCSPVLFPSVLETVYVDDV